MKTFGFIAAAASALILAASCGNSDEKGMTAKLPAQPEIDSVSYLIGIQFGYFIKNNNFGEKLNHAQIRKGMNDFINADGSPQDPEFNKQFKVNPEETNNIFNAFLAKRSAYTAEKNLKVGESFLAKNKMEDGVVVAESGLQYRIIEDGDEVRPGPKDTIYVQYTGTLIDGTEFDASDHEKDPARLFMNRVVSGWTEGLQHIGQGGHIQLFVPAELGYGQRGRGKIEPNSVLIFDIELSEVRPFVEKPKEEKKK